VKEYHTKAADFASCRFLAELGSGTTGAKARTVQELHDRLLRAATELPMA
jgi:hypothetical protein